MKTPPNLQEIAREALDARRAENDKERRVADQLLVEWAVWAGIGVRSHDVAPNVLSRFLPRTAAGMPLADESTYLAVDRAVARLPVRLARVVMAEYQMRGGQRSKARLLGMHRDTYRATLEAGQLSVWNQLRERGVL